MASNDFINECKNYAYMNRYGKLILGEPTTPTVASSIEITNAKASRLLEDKMTKLSTQDETPSPDNPVEVKTVKGYRNLFDDTQLLQATGWTKNDDGYYNGTASNLFNTFKNDGFSFPETFKTNTKYVISCKAYTELGTGNPRFRVFYTDDTYADSTYWNYTTPTNISMTTNGNKTISKIIFTFGNTTGTVYIKDIQVVEQTAKPYVPYGTNWIYTTITDGTNTKNITIPLNNNEICGIGDYKDELIIDKNGHCWLNKKTNKIVFDGSETGWSLSRILTDTNAFTIEHELTNFNVSKVLSNYFIYKEGNDDIQHIRYGGTNNGYYWLYVNKTIVNSKADFQTWLSTHNTDVYYSLATPQLIDLQYDVDLTLYEGTNNISNSENMDMEITYKASVELNQSNKIQEFTIDSGCYDNGNVIGSVYVKKLNAQLIDALDNTLEDVDCDASVGVTYTTVEEVDGEEVETETTEYMNMGSYVVEKPKDEQTTNFSSFVAYDLLMNRLEDKYSTALDYDNETITIADVYEELCTNLGLTPVTTTFTNSTITVENNPFGNGETNRTVLQSICKVACAFVDIDYDTNEIDLKWLSNTLDYTFQKSDYSTVEGGKTVYGPVNSLIIKNSVIDSENVSHSDNTSITLNGEHQLVISEDYFLYNQAKRTEALTNIWNKVNGLTYTECTLNTQTGKPFLKVGSKIRIYTDTNEYFDSYVLQNEFKYDGTFSNTIKCPVLTEQEVQTKQTVDLGYKVRQTEIIVDKQGGTIEEITGQINDSNKAIDGIRTTQTATERRIDVISSNIDENGNITEVTTITGFTFNASGLHISGDGFEANHTSQGTYYKDGDTIVGQYTKDGSKQKDLELFGTYSYGMNEINDTPMFIAQLYTDENGEEGFGHFSNVE